MPPTGWTKPYIMQALNTIWKWHLEILLFHFTTTEMARIQKMDHSKCRRGWKEKGKMLVEWQKDAAPWESSWARPWKAVTATVSASSPIPRFTAQENGGTHETSRHYSKYSNSRNQQPPPQTNGPHTSLAKWQAPRRVIHGKRPSQRPMLHGFCETQAKY